MAAFLLFGGVAFLVAGGAAVAMGSSPGRLAAVIGAGFALLGLFIVWAYFSAPTDSSESRCSDCGMYLGRYWEPQLVMAIGVFNLVAWVAGSLVGAAVRVTARGVLQRAPVEN